MFYKLVLYWRTSFLAKKKINMTVLGNFRTISCASISFYVTRQALHPTSKGPTQTQRWQEPYSYRRLWGLSAEGAASRQELQHPSSHAKEDMAPLPGPPTSPPAVGMEWKVAQAPWQLPEKPAGRPAEEVLLQERIMSPAALLCYWQPLHPSRASWPAQKKMSWDPQETSHNTAAGCAGKEAPKGRGGIWVQHQGGHVQDRCWWVSRIEAGGWEVDAQETSWPSAWHGSGN